MKYIDLTHTFTDNMPVWPGEAAPESVQDASLDKEGVNVVRIKTNLHVGTHIDAPFHFIQNGKKISDFPIEKFIGPGILIDARGRQSIAADLLDNVAIPKGSIVLVLTGHSQKFGTPDYFQTYPVMTENFAQKLVDSKVSAVGVDAPSPDQAPWLIHKMLLPAEVLSLENLTNLESLIGISDFEVLAIPPKFDYDGALVRVFAKIG